MADLFVPSTATKYENNLTPYPYQVELIRETLAALAVHRRVCTQSPAGSGKTVVFNEVIRRCVNKGYKCLVIAHREELITQPREKLYKSCGIVAGIIKSGYEPMPTMPVQIASIQTLTKRNKPQGIKIVIIDECFPAGTLIDGRPIETLEKGEFVQCFNHEKNIVEHREILHIFKSRPETLLKLKLSDGKSIVCTPGHPFYVPALDKYIPAYELLNHKIVTYAKDFTQDLQHLPNQVHSEKLEPKHGTLLLQSVQGCSEAGTFEESDVAMLQLRGRGDMSRPECTCIGEQGPGLLFGFVQSGINEKGFIGNNDTDERNACADFIGKDEKEKSNDGCRVKEKDFGNIEGNGMEAQSTGWKWQGINEVRKAAFRSIGLANECDSSNGSKEVWELADTLQTGHRQRIGKNSRRSGRAFSQFIGEEKAGCQENAIFGILRVESIEVHQQTSSREFGALCPDGFVYNIEVEGNHNYFANDILVHNCHHAISDTYMDVQIEYPDAKIWGVTATPKRASGEGLEKAFDHLVTGVQIKFLEENGYLVPAHSIINPLPAEYFSNCRITGGDYNEKDLANLMDRDEMTEDLVKNYANHAKGLRNCVFAVNVEHSKKIVAAYKRAGIEARHIDGTTPNSERTKIFNDFKDGKFLVLSNVGIATEGTDIPAIECVQGARPTKSLSLVLQMMGRGARIAKGKKRYVLLDHANWIIEHGAPNANRTWTLKGKKINPKEQKVRQFRLVYPDGTERMVNTMTIPKDLKGVQLIEVTDEFRVNGFEKLYKLAIGRNFNKWWAFYKWIAELDTIPSMLELQYIGKKLECKPGWAAFYREKLQRLDNFKDILTPQAVTQ